MAARCTLETEGYQAHFHLERLPRPAGALDARIEVCLREEVGGTSLRSEPTFLRGNELQRLVAYFEGHIARLQTEPNTESPVFVPLELGFQVQALAGDIETANEGEFTLRFLVNVGQPEGRARTYAGAEAVITVQQVRAFVVSLDAVLGELTSVR